MITTVQCSICSQVNNKSRVVVTNFRLHHTCSIILWLHSLSGVIRSLLCNPSTLSSIILWLHSLSGVIRSLFCNPSTFSPAIIIKWVELARNRNKWLGRTRQPYIRAVHARYHVRTNTEKMRDCHLVARTCDNEVGATMK